LRHLEGDAAFCKDRIDGKGGKYMPGELSGKGIVLTSGTAGMGR
jgi:hypothetical protein